MSADSIYAAMCKVVTANASPYLKHYPDDLHIHDRRFLSETESPNAEYLWSVTEYGSHICFLGAHPKDHEFGSAIISNGRTSGRDHALFHASNRGLVSISEEHAQGILKRFRYNTTSRHVFISNSREPIAAHSVTFSTGKNYQPVGNVAFSSPAEKPISLDDLVALKRIAACLVVSASQSLFTPANEPTLNGENISALILQRRDAARTPHSELVA